MKKITLLVVFLFSILGYSQTPLEKIKSYMNDNRSKFALQNQDIADLVIVNDFSSESTGIFNYHVKQKYSGIEILSSDSNFWIKNGEVINGGDEFIANISQKINQTQPSLDVTAGFVKALSSLKNTSLISFQIIESKGNDYKLSNGNLDENPISAKLIYFTTTENVLKLAWDFEFYSQNFNHLWRIKVDATDGKILEQRDLVISCKFDSNHKNHNHNLNSDLFNKTFFKDNSNLAYNPGTTQYRVIPFNYESPNHIERQLVVNPEFITNASPKGWHDTNSSTGTSATLRYNITRGNNVWARNDFSGTGSVVSPNGTSPSGGTYPNLTFDFPYGGTSAVASTYINAANTNLFYMNNVMHDLWYQYGFNEANKNFQANNYGRGGSQGDYVIADAQDGSQAATPNLNNANFSAATDGTSGRMQMYLWDVGPPFFIVNSPADIAGGKVARNNSFSPGNVAIPSSPSPIVSDLVLYNDAVGDGADACQPVVNATQISGKIVVIRRGDCTFAFKVKAAQNAGAIGVIIVNNVNTGAIGMSGADATITIPAISVSLEVGQELITRMQTETVNAKFEKSSSFINTDGDFDNGIVAHEYGHGISGRLSGSCLDSSEQQGEGWSDWFWLMMQIKTGDTRNGSRGIGTFAENEPVDGGGIRRYKYSTDMAVNPHTFGATNTMFFTDADGIEFIDVHSVGSVWAATLWDLAWNYIDKYGYDSNLYTGTGGNNKVMRLVLDAIKLDGCSPSFISARNAIIAADQATTGGQDYCMIWKTFARRGMGVNASSGTNSGVPGIQDQVEDFTEPAPGPNCTLAVNYFENEDMFKVYPNPSNGIFNIRINQYSGKVNMQVVDINGRIVKQLNNEDFNIEKSIDLSSLQSGVYVLKINNNELNYSQKIIKN